MAAPATIRFVEQGHRYLAVTAKGEMPIPSVSEILAGCGLVNYNGISPEVLRQKAEFGSAVHLACQLDDENDLDESSLDPKVKVRLEGWRTFRRDFGFEPETVEQPLLFDYYGMLYGGTPDRIGRLTKETSIGVVRAIVDIKTTCEIEVHHAYQLAAYAMGRKTPDGNKFRRYVVQLLEDGDYRLQEFKDPHEERIFCSALAIEWEKRNKRLK